MTIDKIIECFASALRDEKKERKHKGLLLIKPNREEAEEYIRKAKRNLQLCHFYQEQGFEYKTLRNFKKFLGHQKFLKKFFSVPEEWFYTLYYCALAILCIFGVESRSQRCTAFLLRYIKDKGLIDYQDEFIDRIQVYKEKDALSDVDAREKGRYSSIIHMKEVLLQYDEMMALCKKALAQCEEIVFSKQEYKLPPELIQLIKS